VLKEHTSVRLQIEGHTDNAGPAEQNRTLSQQRADAVRQYMIDKGIDGSRLTAVGFGPDKPVADNKTPDGRAKNRRVEFTRLAAQ
jgi:outer membrane protein OmpA-like peptidoglycan-associated protein